MKLFVYRERSILHNKVIRIINAICLFSLLVLAFSNESILELPWMSSIIVPITSSTLCAYATYKVLSFTDFFDWDYTERQKKKRFTIKYILICETLSSMLIFSACIAYYAISSTKMSIYVYIFFIVPILLLIFNLCNIVSLFYPIFEDDLTLGYKIQKKPDNWQDDGKEIKNEDEIEEIMHRDFRI